MINMKVKCIINISETCFVLQPTRCQSDISFSFQTRLKFDKNTENIVPRSRKKLDYFKRKRSYSFHRRDKRCFKTQLRAWRVKKERKEKTSKRTDKKEQ